MAGAVINIESQDQFKKVLGDAASKLVVVDFTAQWCGPCKMIAPALAQAAKDNPDIIVLKVDVDEQDEITQEYGIAAMPTFLFFKNGKQVKEFSGANKEKLLAHIAELK